MDELEKKVERLEALTAYTEKRIEWLENRVHELEKANAEQTTRE